MSVHVWQFLNSPNVTSTPVHQHSVHSSDSAMDIKHDVRYVTVWLCIALLLSVI